ncbi:tetratricopeptide repeat protein [Trinickia sp. NRRL B-1857]|uniref:tetratricopeptide repeat protein n=1 Tax=Trinickia sp. NRRL B-1857 TaxID=3162879 RepID=UPI003D26B936
MSGERDEAVPSGQVRVSPATVDACAQWTAFRDYADAGALIEAFELVAGWLAQSPDDVDAATAQAELLRLCGRYEQAQAWLDRAILAAPAHAPAWVEAARVAMRMGATERALECFERAHRAAPHSTDGLAEWAALAHSIARVDIGVAVATRWCELAPAHADAWFSLGLAQQQAGALDAALNAYERAVSIDTDLPMLRNNLAALHYNRGDYRAALALGMQALRAEPDHHLAWTNLANVWLRLHEPDKALIAARRACTLAPEFGLAQLALSNAARESQQWSEAFDAVVRAAKLPGAEPKIQFSVAMLQLMQGDWRNGWINFEARWRGSPELDHVQGFCPERRWHGEALAGKTLLVWGEQGHGDAIQFVRFLPQLIEQVRSAGGKLICCCFPPLYTLFKRSLASYEIEVLPSDVPRLPPFDYQLPLASLPLALGVTLESLAAPAFYLIADAASVARWRDETHRGERLKVGLVWTGSRNHQRNPLRAIEPERYAEVLRTIPGIDWYSLQPGAGEDVERITRAGLPIIDRTSELTSFDDTAALVCALDVVVTVCTSVAHLAAALGKPTWLLLDVNPHWVWMTARADSPWYPSVRLYRQHRHRDWTTPLDAVATDLRQAAACMSGARRVDDPAS